MELFSVVFLVVFAVIGIIAFLKEICKRIFENDNACSIMYVLPVKKDCNNAEFLLRSAASKVKWADNGKNDCVICLDCDMDEKNKKICENICKDYGFIKLVSKKEFCEIINNKKASVSS